MTRRILLLRIPMKAMVIVPRLYRPSLIFLIVLERNVCNQQFIQRVEKRPAREK